MHAITYLWHSEKQISKLFIIDFVSLPHIKYEWSLHSRQSQQKFWLGKHFSCSWNQNHRGKSCFKFDASMSFNSALENVHSKLRLLRGLNKVRASSIHLTKWLIIYTALIYARFECRLKFLNGLVPELKICLFEWYINGSLLEFSYSSVEFLSFITAQTQSIKPVLRACMVWVAELCRSLQPDRISKVSNLEWVSLRISRKLLQRT